MRVGEGTPTWRHDGEVASGRVRALRCGGVGLRSWPEGGEEGGVGAREGRRLEAKGGRDGEGPGGGRPQGETLELEKGDRRKHRLQSWNIWFTFRLSEPRKCLFEPG